jgi:DNA-binding NtrC family response regulator
MSRSRQALRALIVEDNPGDAGLVVIELEQCGFDLTWQRVETEADYRAALDPQLDVILSDFELPTFNAPWALDILMATNLDVPLIVVSGTMAEDTAVRMLRAGAADFLFKNDLTRLGEAVRGALEEREIRAERRASR